jgi:hypothetical protein
VAAKTIDEYVASLGRDWRADTVTSLRRIVDAAAPNASSSTIKWAQPVWESDVPFAYIKAFERSVNIGFWRGAELDDPAGILKGEGERMKHLTLREGDTIPADELSALVRQAVSLNREFGSPARTRSSRSGVCGAFAGPRRCHSGKNRPRVPIESASPATVLSAGSTA